MLLQNLPQTRQAITDLGDETVFMRIQKLVFDMDRFGDKTAVQYILRARHKLTHILFQVIAPQ